MAARFVQVMRIRFPLPFGAVDVPRLLAAADGGAGTQHVLGDHKAVAEDRGRAQSVQADSGLKAPPAKPRKRRSKSDKSLSVGTIAATMAGVIVVSFAGTALLPSILTRDPVRSTTIAIAPPAVQPRQTDARPIPPPAPELPAPAADDAKTTAAIAPALRPSSVPRSTAAVAAPRRPATARPALTAEEKAAVERGLRELEKAPGQAGAAGQP